MSTHIVNKDSVFYLATYQFIYISAYLPTHLNAATVELQTQLGRPLDLFSPEYLRSTLQLWLLWFGTAFAYYGMVLVSS